MRVVVEVNVVGGGIFGFLEASCSTGVFGASSTRANVNSSKCEILRVKKAFGDS
jgi:hypothetical protein